MDPKNQIEIIKQGVDEIIGENDLIEKLKHCLLYTSDAADES